MKRYQPALLGGLFVGVLSCLPVVGGCCCLWVICGGLLTAYLQQQAKPEPIEPGEAVIGGLIAGVIGAMIVCLYLWLKMMILGPVVNDAMEQVRQQLEANSQIPPQTRDFIVNLISGRGMIGLVLLFQLPTYAVFGMLGSLLGFAFFRKKTPPPATSA